jgi:hypothetical protein
MVKLKKLKSLPSSSAVDSHNSTSTTRDQQPSKLNVKLQHEEQNTLGGDQLHGPRGPETKIAFTDLADTQKQLPTQPQDQGQGFLPTGTIHHAVDYDHSWYKRHHSSQGFTKLLT